MSDIHFGSGRDLLGSQKALERLAPELEWADCLILNGDVFELLTGQLEKAVDASRAFFGLVGEHVDQVIYLPGNHDYHFVAHASNTNRLQRFIGGDEETDLFRLREAEQLIQLLTGKGVNVTASYPIHEVDGVIFHHGHYMMPHLKSLPWRIMDRMSWRIAGLDRSLIDRLSISDYEALMAPLHELFYQASQLPSSERTRVGGERFLARAAKILRAPGNLKKSIGLKIGTSGEDDRTAAEAIFQLIKADEAAEAIAQVCKNLRLDQSAQICVGHSHAPFTNVVKHGWKVHNTGSWVLDEIEMRLPSYRRLAWPGTVLRFEDGKVEKRGLLDDLSLEEIIDLTERERPSMLPPWSDVKPEDLPAVLAGAPTTVSGHPMFRT